MARHTTRSAAGALAVAVALSTPATALAQEQRTQAPHPHAQAASDAAQPVAPSIVSLDRVRRQLRETPPTRDPTRPSSLLKLEYYVQVVGSPPPIDFFKNFHIGRASTVQYGGMTHDEFLKVTGPFWRRTW